jgi:glycerophosphoryl diester phosphodiesterase
VISLLAHRGASAYAPENTLPSFRKALEMGAGAIELDVQLTADGTPVVIHDFYLNKTTDGSGLVRSHSWKEIRRLDAGSRFSSAFSGTPIPSLEEVLALIPSSVLLNVEIKSISMFQENTAQKVMEMLAQEPDRDLIISSFNHPCLKTVREMDRNVKIGILTGSDMVDFSSYIRSTGLAPFSVHPEASYLTEDYVRRAHEEGWQVISYTINTIEGAEALRHMGADGFFSDYPDLLEKAARIGTQ